MTYSKDNIVFAPKPTIHNFIDHEGQTFTRLYVLGYAGTRKPKIAAWWCECSCGRIVRVDAACLRQGGTKSCGCWNRDNLAEFRVTHGLSRHGMKKPPELEAYYNAKARCENPRRKDRQYQKRGIKFLFTSFKEFYADVGPRPSPQHSLDRKNNDGNYEPGNLQWSLGVDQCRNKSTNRLITIGRVTQCIAAWAQETGMRYLTVYNRLTYQRWCAPCSISPLVKSCEHKSVPSIAKGAA